MSVPFGQHQPSSRQSDCCLTKSYIFLGIFSFLNILIDLVTHLQCRQKHCSSSCYFSPRKKQWRHSNSKPNLGEVPLTNARTQAPRLEWILRGCECRRQTGVSLPSPPGLPHLAAGMEGMDAAHPTAVMVTCVCWC